MMGMVPPASQQSSHPLPGMLHPPVSRLAFQQGGKEGTTLQQLQFRTGRSREPAQRGWAKTFPCALVPGHC